MRSPLVTCSVHAIYFQFDTYVFLIASPFLALPIVLTFEIHY